MSPNFHPEAARPQSHLANSTMWIQSQLADCRWPSIPNDSGAQALALQYQLERTQWWPADEIRRAQFRQLQHVLDEACQKIAWWKEALHRVDFAPARSLTENQFAALPILSRGDMQNLGANLLNPHPPASHGTVSKSSTSGSTGQPVIFYKTDLTQHFWRGLTLREHLWQRRDFSGKLAAIRSNVEKLDAPNWGAATENVIRTGPSCSLNIRADIDEQLNWLSEQNPAYLLTHPSNLRALARRALERRVSIPGLLQLRTFGEVLPDETRTLCRQVWNAEIADIYSSEEVGYIALQCEQGAYHVQSENILVEIVDDHGSPCEPGQAGRILITTLHNFALPFVRYEIGDYGEWGTTCPCGRGLPVLRRIMGRARNMIKLPDGTQHWPSFPEERWVGIAPIQQLQAVQKSPDTVVLNIKAARPLTEEEIARLTETFRITLKFPYRITVQRVEDIPRAKNAKFEDFICEI